MASKKPKLKPILNTDHSTPYQTYLPGCDCGDGGILIKDGEPYCRWCRTPYGEGFMIDYKDSHFVKG